MNILLTSIGKRGYLVDYFKKDIPHSKVFTSDCDVYAPGNFISDSYYLVPNIEDKLYVQSLLKICQEKKIDIVVPLHDLELPILSANSNRFEDVGAKVIVSPLETTLLCQDKFDFFTFCSKEKILSPLTYKTLNSFKTGLKAGKISFPVIVKSRKGYGSMDFHVVSNISMLETIFIEKKFIIQQYIDGQEFGIDLFFNKSGKLESLYMKKKLLMRSGETDKAITVKDKIIKKTILNLSQKFRFFGPCDVDVFLKEDKCFVMEINPRFGGGYALSHKAGANFLRKIVEMINGNNSLNSFDYDYKEGLVMMKDLDFIFMDEEKIK